MTRQVLVSPRLPELRSGNAALDVWVREHLQRYVSEVFEQLAWTVGESGEFTATVRGSGTAGTYEVASQQSWYYRIGDLVYLSVDISMAAVLTGGGTGNLQISGLPYQKLNAHYPVGSAVLSGIDFTANASLASAFSASTGEVSSLWIVETTDTAATAAVPISAVGASDRISLTITYITNGVRAS